MSSQRTHTHTHQTPPHPEARPGRRETCAPVPEFKRLKYFYGQMLGVEDFQAEQDFFREKLKLHNRCLHGYGTLCGLEVVPEPMEEECGPPPEGERGRIERELERLREEHGELKDEAKRKEMEARIAELRRKLECLPKEEECKETPRTRVHILCGLAYDCEGNELVVRRPLVVDLLAALSPQEARRVQDSATTLYVSLCYCAQPVDPARPVLPDVCGTTVECAFGKLRDSVRVHVSVDPPSPDLRCEPCCDPCADPCLLLARIDCFEPGKPLVSDQIHNEVRRRMGPYVLTRISGISWTHGAEYTPQEAASLLGTGNPHGGLEVRFSRPVLTSTIRPGVVDVVVMEGGRGRAGNIYHMAGEYVGLPSALKTDRLRYRQSSEETLQHGDRVLLTLRASFLLDECCYAVDGENIGGRVPIIVPDYERYRRGAAVTECVVPPNGFGPWFSGNGAQAGTFEGWFYVK